MNWKMSSEGSVDHTFPETEWLEVTMMEITRDGCWYGPLDIGKADMLIVMNRCQVSFSKLLICVVDIICNVI